jgi:hypothetical protein
MVVEWRPWNIRTGLINHFFVLKFCAKYFKDKEYNYFNLDNHMSYLIYFDFEKVKDQMSPADNVW